MRSNHGTRLQRLEARRGQSGRMEPEEITAAVARYRAVYDGFGMSPESFGAMLASAPAHDARIYANCDPEDFYA